VRQGALYEADNQTVRQVPSRPQLKRYPLDGAPAYVPEGWARKLRALRRPIRLLPGPQRFQWIIVRILWTLRACGTRRLVEYARRSWRGVPAARSRWNENPSTLSVRRTFHGRCGAEVPKMRRTTLAACRCRMAWAQCSRNVQGLGLATGLDRDLLYRDRGSCRSR